MPRPIHIALGTAGVATALATLAVLARAPAARVDDFPVALLAQRQAEAVGTPPRRERELKFALSPAAGAEPDALEGDARLQALIQHVHDALARDLASPEWQAPRVVGKPYFGPPAPMLLVVRDVYLDTPELTVRRNDAGYRLRHRFKTLDDMRRHDADVRASEHWPYRCEIQSKVDRVVLGPAENECIESRFEYRKESAPFSIDQPPPPPPWLTSRYLVAMRAGTYEGKPITPAAALSASLVRRGVTGSLQLLPHAVVISVRYRTHLEIATPYGSGPNPTQAYIVTLDHSDVFEGAEYARFLAAAETQRVTPPARRGQFTEVEVEFERNVSTRVDEACAAGSDPMAPRARDAFHADQRRICERVLGSLAERRIDHRPQDSSKYEQTCQVLEAK